MCNEALAPRWLFSEVFFCGYGRALYVPMQQYVAVSMEMFLI